MNKPIVLLHSALSAFSIDNVEPEILMILLICLKPNSTLLRPKMDI